MRLSEDDSHAEVDLAPLIDCVFLLLIFFLVATQLSEFEDDLEFEIPPSEAALQVSKEFDMIPVQLDDMERVRLPNVYCNLRDQQLKDKARDLMEQKGAEIELFINIHPEAEFQSVTYLVDIFKLMGFEDIELRTYGITGDFKQRFQQIEAQR